MDFEKNIKLIEKKIGYTFKDKGLLRQAFTRTSYCNEHKDRRGIKYQSNEVLEFFGDSILSAAIVTLLMKDFSERYEYGISTTLCEGDFSNIKSKLSDKKNLSLATGKLGLHKFLLMGEGDAKLGIENEPSVMEDLFESVVGAIYIDSGNDMKSVIASLSVMLEVGNYLESKAPPIQSFKNALQEWCADKNRKLCPPTYKTISESGPDHKKIYERACYIGDKVYGIGKGKNQKLADAAAAEDALNMLIAEEKRRNALAASKEAEKSLVKLKDYAQKNKKTTPEFRDLGVSADSDGDEVEYEIECRFDGMSAVGRASSKHEAKAIAADKILKMTEDEAKLPKTVKKVKSKAAVKHQKGAKAEKTLRKPAPVSTKKPSSNAQNRIRKIIVRHE